ncbi:ABC transporter substrate-binding protein [Thermosyntropha sp.]|uniref:ABC transporter substrate-binding protein n=1 Tax=Thermosyntropha sp. TaxID=2740820 RepID=UPI0025FB6EFF|nr:ABC transporter substrate-binding protein [Thermosyntropha sp.]MBO8158929.1 ABC transporter substrate-binding protein [Thermosyntropha sp.]
MKKGKRLGFVLCLILMFALLVSGCGQQGGKDAASRAEQVPVINMGYIFTTHHAPFIVAMAKGEDFKEMGTYLKEVVPKEKYELIEDGKKVADVNVVVTKSGSETATLFAQGNLDIALSSVTAFMTGIDKGTEVKVISPLQAEGIAVVFPQKSNIKDWDAFAGYLAESPNPVKIGYHSPTSAPKIVFEAALKSQGLKVTEDPNDSTADVLLVDLKGTSNFIPAMNSKQVDGVVAPAPFPNVAEVQGVGKIAFQIADMPPEGRWVNVPCCVMGARDEVMADNPAVVKAMVKLMSNVSKWCNDNAKEAADITAEWIGVPPEAAENSVIVYSTDPNADWMRGIETFLDSLNQMGKLNGELKDKKLEEVKDILFDFSFLR